MPNRLPAPVWLSALRRALPALLAVAAAFAAAFAAPPCLAQETVRATPGIETLIKRDKAALAVKEGPKRGKTRIETVTDDGERINRLLYMPNPSTEAFQDGLTYALNGADTKVAIEVELGTGRPLGLTPGTPAYEAGFKVLFILFVLAVILESALGLLFDWRPFVETFNGRSVKPLVSFGVALILVKSFDLDLVRDFVTAITPGSTGTSNVGPYLTAMVIGGGSAGVNNVLVALGYRQKRAPETVAPKPPPDKAWISVRVERIRAVGPVCVFIDAIKPAVGEPRSSLAGVIQSGSRPLRDYFLASRNRFPRYGGHAVEANAAVTVKVSWRESPGIDGKAQEKIIATFIAAGGAFVDLEAKL